jgi:hypothetical protein
MVERSKAVSAARQRAFRALARAHRDEFTMILNQERRAVGLPPSRRPAI